MAIKRSQRQFGIQPIGVNRVAPYNQDVAQEIVGIADDIYQRNYQIAKGDAVERGETAAAEAPLASITQLDPDTKVPMAMQLAQNMGRFSQEAFERAALRRFEGAISDNIAAKKAEMMARLSDSPDAPKLFEKAFSEYLSGLSGNASGYYKQVIVDHGASQLSDGRTRLHVAQIARMQAEAKAEAERRHKAALRSSYDAGMSGSPFALGQTTSEFRAVEADAQAIGASAPDVTTKRGKELRESYLRGAASGKLQDPALSSQAGLIYQVLRDGKNPALYSLLDARGKNFIASLEVAFDVDERIDYAEIAETLKPEFASAEKSAAFIAEDIKQRQDAYKANLESQEEADKADADQRIVEQYRRNNEGSAFSVGFTALPAQVQQEKNRLLGLDDGLNLSFVGVDKLKSIEKEQNAGLIQLAQGVVSRELNRLVSQGAKKEQLEIYRDILKNPETQASKDALRSLLGQSLYDVVATELTSVNGEALASVASDILAGVQTGIDHRANMLKQGMRQAKVEISSLIRSPNASISEVDSRISLFEQNFGDVDSMPESLGDLKSQRDNLVKERRAEDFVTQANTIVNSVTPDNLNEKVSQLARLASDLDQDPASVEAYAIEALGKVVSEEISLQMKSFKQDQSSLTQLSSWSTYLSDVDTSISLPPDQKEFLDGLKKRSVIVNGKEIFASKESIANSASAVYNRIQKSFQDNQAYSRKRANITAIGKGTYVTGASTNDGRIAYENLLKEKNGVIDTSALMYKPELSDQDIDVLSDIMNNRGILPQSIVDATSAFMTGGLPQDQMMAYAQRARGILFFEDANGNIKITAGAKAALGSDASKFTMIVKAVQKLPAGLESQTMQATIDQLNLAASDPKVVNAQIELLTKEPDAASLAATLDGIRPEQIQEFATLATAMAGIPSLSAKLKENLQQVLDTEYLQNNNMYSGWGRGSSSSFAPERYGEGYTDIVESYIPELIRTNELKNVYFEANSDVSIEDFYRSGSYLGELAGDTLSTVSGKMTISDQLARARGGEGRIVYGETFDSTHSNPKYQLLVINELGLVEATGVSFYLRDAIKSKGLEMPDLGKKFFPTVDTSPSDFGSFGSVAPIGNQ